MTRMLWTAFIELSWLVGALVAGVIGAGLGVAAFLIVGTAL